MKQQLLLFAAIFPCFIVWAQTETNDLAARQLRGKVKSVTETEYEVVEKFGEPERGAKKKVDSREYNTAGNETEHQLEDFTRAGEKTTRWFRYQDKTKVIEIKEEEAGKVKLTKIEYNAQGKMGTVDFTDGQGNLENRQKYKYDADGLLVQIDTYNSDGTLKFKIIRTYNAIKQLVKKDWFNEVGNLFDAQTYAYDASGNMVKETDLNIWAKATDTITRIYRYNEKKQKIEEGYSNSGDGTEKLLFNDVDEWFEYNEQGDMIRKWAFLTEEKVVYTYDRNNNWIKALKTSGSTIDTDLFGKPKQELVEREIKYY